MADTRSHNSPHLDPASTRERYVGGIKDFFTGEVPEIMRSEYEAAKDIGGMIAEDVSRYLERD